MSSALSYYTQNSNQTQSSQGMKISNLQNQDLLSEPPIQYESPGQQSNQQSSQQPIQQQFEPLNDISNQTNVYTNYKPSLDLNDSYVNTATPDSSDPYVTKLSPEHFQNKEFMIGSDPNKKSDDNQSFLKKYWVIILIVVVIVVGLVLRFLYKRSQSNTSNNQYNNPTFGFLDNNNPLDRGDPFGNM